LLAVPNLPVASKEKDLRDPKFIET